jgi:hypothetical protein
VQRLHEKVLLLNHPETKALKSLLAASWDASLLVSTSGELPKAAGKLGEGDESDTDYHYFKDPSKTHPDYEKHEETGDGQGPLQPLQHSSGGDGKRRRGTAASPVSSVAARAARCQTALPTASKQTSSAQESAVQFNLCCCTGF